MNEVWKWVHQLDDELRENGQSRTADLIYKICDDDPKQVDAVFPEALAAARALKHPWLEVYFRHWNLQSRVIKSGEGASALQETAALLEFAHRDETQECPQSVCVTQDLASCYANIDGPGWAEERMALCEETLARIEPSRNCFDCITREYADALLDLGRPLEARAYLDAQAARMLEAGQELSDGYSTWQAETWLAAGEPDKALAILDKAEVSEFEFIEHARQIMRARCLAELNRIPEADEALPPFSAIAAGQHANWVLAVVAITRRAPERNTWQTGNLLGGILGEFERKGAYRHCVTVALQHGELALMRGAAWTARFALERARLQVQNLKADAGAAAAIAALEKQIAEKGNAVPMPVPAAELVAHILADKEPDPERHIDWLVSACAERPADAGLAVAAANAMEACGAPAKAREHLWAFLNTTGPDQTVAARLLDFTLQAADMQQEVERLAAFVERTDPLNAHWCRARLAYQMGDWSAVAEHTGQMFALKPEESFLGVRHLAADAAMHAGDLARALELRRWIVDNSPEVGSPDWDLMVVASILGDWATVRHSAARLGMTLESTEGPISENWGWVRLIFDEDGEKRFYFGRRTGPVTAKVVHVAQPHLVQHVNDEVVFDAIPQEPAPEDEEERKQWIPPFNVVHIARRGGYTGWIVDGVHPGDELFDKFCEDMNAKGWNVWNYSNDQYTVNNPMNEAERLPGIFFALAAPSTVPPQEVDTALRSATAGWSHPWAWRELARAAGEDVEHHQHIIDTYGL